MNTQYQIDIGLGYPLPTACGCPSNYLDIMTSYISHLCCSWTGFTAPMPGIDWEIGIKAEQLVVLSGGTQQVQAIDLTGASALFTMKIMDTDPVGFTRSSNADLPGILPASPQISIDDQSVDNGSGGVSGRGWMRIKIAHTEQLVLMPFANVGLNQYDLRVQLAGGIVFTLLRGRIEIIRSMSKSF